ncbi:PREDICTED: large proline-rich protein BAG6-like [Priapulus caudatus]|uniref:Large proline-rich protein BAG6 n=1 Tax=Priapulus caudatus TaxID=37621 RepID=A0ABM1DRJ1_PRICU|nr:PREDICTED: large proline-rich protein BAG6-like [Priapulus caudatus]
MLDVTVKTLDGQNHSYSVPDDTTVRTFKERIASSVSIPVDTQRLIYHGRVLQDDKKLIDYDVNGKVLHLVQKPPPSSQPAGTSTATPTHSGTHGQPVRGQDSFIVGAFTVPSETADHSQIQQVVQQLVGGMGELGRNAQVSTSPAEDGQSVNLHISLGPIDPAQIFNDPQQRLNTAVRLVGLANQALDRLDNPNDDVSPTGPAAQDFTSPPAEGAPTIIPPGATVATEPGPDVPMDTSSPNETTSSSDGGSRQTGAPPPTHQPQQEGGNDRAQHPPCPPRGLADVMTEVTTLNARLVPYLERFQQLMRDDPELGDDAQRIIDAQRTFNLVSAAMHHLGHAYHDISDLMIDMRHPAPRHLLNPPRAVVMYPQHRPPHGVPMHTHVSVPVTIAMAVPTPQASSTLTGSAGTAAAATQVITATTTVPSASATMSTGQQPQTHQQPQMHQQPVINIRRPVNGPQGAPMNPFMRWGVGPTTVTINRISTTIPAEMPHQPSAAASSAASGATSAATTASGGTPVHQTHATPATSGNNQPPREQMPHWGPPGQQPGAMPQFLPPELLQNLLGAAAGAAVRGMQGTFQPRPDGANPTTATRTRPTATLHIPRPSAPPPGVGMPALPHPMVSLDPFLPCSSRHCIPARPRMPPGATPQAAHDANIADIIGGVVNSFIQQQVVGGLLGTGVPGMPFQPPMPPGVGQAPAIHLQNMAQLLRNAQQNAPQQTPRVAAPPTGANEQGATDEVFLNLLQSIAGQFSADDSVQRVTIGEFLSSLGEEYQLGQEGSIISDLFFCLANHLTFNDLMRVMFGEAQPLQDVQPQILAFVNERVLQGQPATEANVSAAVDRIMDQLMAHLGETVADVEVNDGVDYLATVSAFVRARLRHVVGVVIGSETDAAGFGERVRASVERSLQECIALHLHCLRGGQPAFMALVSAELRRITADTNPLIQQWIMNTVRQQLAAAIPNVSVTVDDVRCYVTGAATPAPPSAPAPAARAEATPMVTAEDGIAMAMDSSDESMHSAQEPSEEDDDETAADSRGARRDDWRGVVPHEWVDVISRDIETQQHQRAQASMSDAYLQGMPAKRRRVSSSIHMADGKPLSSSLPDLLKKAISATGAHPVTSVAAVTKEAAESMVIQELYEQQVKHDIKRRLEADSDYNPGRFPHTDDFFADKQ